MHTCQSHAAPQASRAEPVEHKVIRTWVARGCCLSRELAGLTGLLCALLSLIVAAAYL